MGELRESINRFWRLQVVLDFMQGSLNFFGERECILAATHILNLISSSVINWKTPYERLFFKETLMIILELSGVCAMLVQGKGNMINLNLEPLEESSWVILMVKRTTKYMISKMRKYL